jgi:hypothetical protein
MEPLGCVTVQNIESNLSNLIIHPFINNGGVNDNKKHFEKVEKQRNTSPVNKSLVCPEETPKM